MVPDKREISIQARPFPKIPHDNVSTLFQMKWFEFARAKLTGEQPKLGENGKVTVEMRAWCGAATDVSAQSQPHRE